MQTYKKSPFFTNFFEKEIFSETRDVRVVVEAAGDGDRVDSGAGAGFGVGSGTGAGLGVGS
jgi:hypothetical protein